MQELPSKLIKLEQVRIERGLDKICKCKTFRYTMDDVNRRVTCQSCGAPIDAYDAMHNLAVQWENINKDLERVFEQKKELDNYKPHLKVIKELESKTRAQSLMHPICPTCDEPFMLSELDRFYRAKFITGRIVERLDWQRKETEKAKELRGKLMELVKKMSEEELLEILEQRAK